MSSASTVYSGLSWIGETQAKISFYVFLFITIIFALIMIWNIIKESSVYFGSKTSQADKQKSKIKLEGLSKLFIILGLIFGLVLVLAFYNMEEAEHSKAYAATEGAMDILSNVNHRW
jgi:hypothetical protein